MHDRTPWTRGGDGPRVIKDHTYKNLTEFWRPCAACDKPFSIFVTKKIASGEADSNSFGLKNCPEHRRGSTRTESPELEALRMANSVMKQELEGLYERDAEQFAELQELKARVAIFETEGFKVLNEREHLWNTRQGGLTAKLPWE